MIPNGIHVGGPVPGVEDFLRKWLDGLAG
jgi:hypothetical protein